MNRKRLFCWLAAIGAITAILMVAFYFDESVRTFVAEHHNRTLHHAMQNVSRFGDWPEHFALGLILIAIAWRRGRDDWRRIFVAMLLALAIAGLAGRVIKISTGRARPTVKLEQGWNGLRLSSNYHAFPSGHVTASMGFFGVLLFTKRRIGLACLPIPIGIACSRVYLGAHFLSDVIFAAVLGLVCAWGVWHFLVRDRQPPLTHQ